ncbi:ScbR family autoregulator-binding transcription factor [Streptomyces goshikiensis]|uniref:ScbR family autoregulator-binding transcription factor n=1 Tax=Streptomyces goshikiensis TaxID=1942 RepID=UPI0033DC234B
MTKQERAVRTRHALLRSAAAAFDQRGYAAATLSLISNGAGVSPGALHFHFENKAAIAAAVELEAADTLCMVATHVYMRQGSALQALADTSHALARAFTTDVVVRAGFQLGREAAYVSSLDLHKDWERYVHRLLARAAEQNTLQPGLSHRQMAAMVVAATVGFEVLGQGEREWVSAHSLTSFWRLILPSLATPEALGELDPTGGRLGVMSRS